MTTYYLLNTVSIQSTSGSGPTTFRAGDLVDSAVHVSATISGIQAVGGMLWPAADPIVAASAAIAQKLRAKGADENVVGRVMLAAAAQSASTNPDVIETPQAVLTNADQAETSIASMVGTGTIIGAYYLPNAASAPAAGANSQAMALNVYKADGTLVGALAAATLNNANPMVKYARFSLGALTNATFADGYTVTAAVTHTGTATLPAGQWIIVTQLAY